MNDRKAGTIAHRIAVTGAGSLTAAITARLLAAGHEVVQAEPQEMFPQPPVPVLPRISQGYDLDLRSLVPQPINKGRRGFKEARKATKKAAKLVRRQAKQAA